MDHRRHGGHAIRSGRRFFPDSQPAEAEHEPDSHPDRFPNTTSYTDSFTPANRHCNAIAHSNVCAQYTFTPRTDVHILADEYSISLRCHCE